MILTGLADELHWESEKKISYQEGVKDGRKEGAIQMMVELLREQKLPEQEILTRVMRKFSVGVEEASRYLDVQEQE